MSLYYQHPLTASCMLTWFLCRKESALYPDALTRGPGAYKPPSNHFQLHSRPSTILNTSRNEPPLLPILESNLEQPNTSISSHPPHHSSTNTQLPNRWLKSLLLDSLTPCYSLALPLWFGRWNCEEDGEMSSLRAQRIKDFDLRWLTVVDKKIGEILRMSGRDKVLLCRFCGEKIFVSVLFLLWAGSSLF